MTRQNEPLPGEAARQILKRTCSAETMERVFDPFIADLQAEWLAARSSRRSAYARWRLCNAYGAFVVQIIVCGFGSLGRLVLAPAPAAGATGAAASLPSTESTTYRLIRFCGPPAFASAITFSLFVLMSILIAQQPGSLIDDDRIPISILRIRLIPDSTPVPLKPALPERPVEDVEPITSVIEIPGATQSARKFISPPVHSGKISTAGIDVRLNLVADDNRQASPIVRVNPVYPARALQRGIEGWVEVEFTINAAGGVSDPRVMNAQPRATFDRAALQAIGRWKYEPMLVDGNPTAQPGVRTRLFFELE